ncbi:MULTISPECIES: PD-(D/E)XK nuclease-like domain-containing protein [Providencia]|uniref:PD-(D/E)XK nuclease-like domain-containing protein n=1 Tax=Providencia TaxID=586 RepID=UPI00197E24C7|nr:MULTISPECIES: PD-(D/E)XK nuclease-like domain-containing protein [Providencia]MBN4863308.1 PD-(D/E)XK nuclease-like domain-containing protein [Providencia stuartii]MBN4876433.1 PD-(D/E)XK nuclease-like domain-containing protein [Providencia stuartii]MBN4878249.1 PD-(D/E)XK nuclease-like domain-containing protein [Providencia stuartii]MBN4881831.1 PD-(D/E)XK nuclease-like domain-containing protein [Providencia stuartii]
MSNQEQEQFEQRKLSNIVSAILMANDINTPENIDKLTNHLNKAATSEEFEPFEKVAFELSITTTSTPKLMFLHDNDIINAYIHVIKNPDKFRSNIDRKKYFQSLVSPDKEEVIEPAKPDVITHASEDKQIGNVEPEVMQECSLHLVPPYFEPGRYTDVSNDDYHSSNGISSTMLKDGRISLMYFERRHISKVIQRERSEALDFGSLFHTLVLEPEKVEDEFSLAPTIPAGAFTNTDSIKTFIREYNADKPKAEQLKLTGKKEELAASVKAVKPDAVFEDDLISAWQADESRIRITGDQYRLGKAMQQAVFDHPEAGKLVTNPNRAVEVSYYGIDDDTGLEVRVRPDLEIQYDENLRVGFDLKSASLGRYKQDAITAMIRKEIINRDYHVSAAMYCDIAMLDQFFWIFVNKDEDYHWVAIVEASPELLELGRLEYKKTLRDINNSMNTGVWPAPVTETLTINLTDLETRKLEELQLEA